MDKDIFSDIDFYDEIEDYDDFEDWECDADLINAKDFKGLIKYRTDYLKRHPNDINAKWRLGEAYILNEEYERALRYLTELHREEPDDGNIQYSILDALFALGKNENDFDWIEKPVIVNKNQALEISYEIMRNKRKSKTISDVYCDLLIEGYLSFDEHELYNALINDVRFDIEKDDFWQWSKVKVVKKKI